MSGLTALPRRGRAARRRADGPFAPTEAGTDADTGAARPLGMWADPAPGRVSPGPASDRVPVWTDPVRADLGGPDTDWTQARWWWLGVHGGAGVSTLAAMAPGGADAHRRWPDPAKGGPHPVLLVARAHAQGLRRARAACRQWAARDVPDDLHLAGVVLVAAAPGRLPGHLGDQVRLLTGITPARWWLPWQPELLDLPDPAGVAVPPALHPLIRDLTDLRGDPLS